MTPHVANTAEKIVTAGVLIIGNEILSGRTQDLNLNHIAKGLSSVGVTRRGRDHRCVLELAARQVRLRLHHRRHRPDA